MNEPVTLEAIAAGVARIDERTHHILDRMNKQNGRVDKHDERLDRGEVEITEVKGEIKGIRSNLKIYLGLAGIASAGAAGHDKIAALFSAVFGG